MHLETVLCPVDFSDLTTREVDAAVEVCRAFGARLVLHHNLSSVSAGMGRAWEWDQTHRAGERSEAAATRRLDELVARVPADVPTETVIGRGPLGMVLRQIAEELPADLVVMACHGASTEEHASTTERLLEDCPCPVLTVQESTPADHPFQLASASGPLRAVVPTDFSPGAQPAVSYAFALARLVPIQLHLLHVLPGPEFELVDAGAAVELSAEAVARRRLDDVVPADLEDRVTRHVLAGDPAQRIAELAARVDADFVVMGEHARGIVRRLLTRDTSRRVLHRAGRPVWFVPPLAA